jgi:hypothetical protein
MGNNTTDISGAISRAKEYPMQDILERFGCTVRHNRCACPIHQARIRLPFRSKIIRGYVIAVARDSIALYQELFKVDFVTA